MRRPLIFLAILLTLAGCGFPITDAQRRHSPEGQLLVRFFEAVRTRDWVFIKAHLAPRHVASPDLEGVLDVLNGQIPDGTPNLVAIPDWFITVTTETGRTVSLSARYDFPRGAVVVVASMIGKGETLKVDRFLIFPIDPQTGEARSQPIGRSISFSRGYSAPRSLADRGRST